MLRRNRRGRFPILPVRTWSKRHRRRVERGRLRRRPKSRLPDPRPQGSRQAAIRRGIAQRLLTNFQYGLLSGEWRNWLSSRIANRVAGRWSVNGITRLQSGVPISTNSPQNTTGSFGGGQRPNSTGLKRQTDESKKDRIGPWFDRAAFVDAPPGEVFNPFGDDRLRRAERHVAPLDISVITHVCIVGAPGGAARLGLSP